MYIASDGIHTAVISRDPMPTNPREPDYIDNQGIMVCWHRRYQLGDKHAYEDAQEFFEDLANTYLDEQDLFHMLKAGTLKTLRLEQSVKSKGSDNPQVIFDIQYNHGSSSSSPDWRSTGSSFSATGELQPTAKESLPELFELMTTRELQQVIEQSGKLAMLPVYLYDHGSISVSTDSFIGRAVHAEWDSGQIGFIYMDKARATDELCFREDIWQENALDLLKEEVAVYDNYLTDSVYSLQLFTGLNEEYLAGDYNLGSKSLKDGFEEILDGWHPELASQFVHHGDQSFDIADYFEENDFPAFRAALSREVEAFLKGLGEPYPYSITKTDLLQNKDGILDTVVEALYQAHEIPSGREIFYEIADAAGYSREVQPRLTASDLAPGKDYTKEELQTLLNQKTNPLDALISQACNKKETPEVAEHNIARQEPDFLHP